MPLILSGFAAFVGLTTLATVFVIIRQGISSRATMLIAWCIMAFAWLLCGLAWYLKL